MAEGNRNRLRLLLCHLRSTPRVTFELLFRFQVLGSVGPNPNPRICTALFEQVNMTQCHRSNTQGSVNDGFQTVVRVLWGNEIPIPPSNLYFTSILPLLNLVFTSIKPLLSRQSRPTVWKPRFTDPCIGHFLRGRSLKGRCDICANVPVCVPVCVPRLPPMTPPVLWG